ncbi:MAG: 3-methyl-2-oxobutanoate hydroxymethyltransferase [Candidatus Omnitrophota bacterium]|jgi:3-methyl-2-oxobutanoate hydroxymethyltransferase
MSTTTPRHIVEKKQQGGKLAMLTAYDTPFARIIDGCGIDIILVGDSVANVVLGMESTRQVDIDVMLHHARAVCRGVSRALVVGDLPYATCQKSAEGVLADARRFLEDAGCGAVKIEWFKDCLPVVQTLIRAGVPVMGHVGLTPQTAEELGGYKVQGKGAESARAILEQAALFEDAGCFAVVLECIPDRLAGLITRHLTIPTIGIGAGVQCDGQVLVLHDILGLFDRFRPKFVKTYVHLDTIVQQAVRAFQEDVRDGVFPEAQHRYTIADEEYHKLQSWLGSKQG